MKKVFLNCMLLLCALIVGSSSVWATDDLYYTLTPATGSDNGYASDEDIEIDDVTWNVTGNSTLTPWRIGGKSLSGVDRVVYSKTAMGAAITEVKLTVGNASSITVNSLKLIVSTAQNGGGTEIDEVSATFEANSTISFKPTSPATQWAKDAYYKFVFNVTVSGNSNKFVEFSEAKFYTPETAKTDPTITFNNGSVRVGKSLNLGSLFSSDSDGAVTYSITEGGSYASIDETTLTGSAVGSVTVQASQAATLSYNAKVVTATISVVDPALSSIAITTAPTKTTYDEGDLFDATGMVVTATFADESIEVVTASCTWEPSGALATTDDEVTISYTYNAVTKTATQGITVNAYTQETQFDINFNNALFGTSYSGIASGITDDAPVSGKLNRVNVIYAGSGNHYINDSQIRFYPNTKLTFEAPFGYVITKIVFTSGTTWAATISSSNGTYTSGTKTWTGAASTVLFTGSGSSRCDMNKAAITLSTTVPATITAAGWTTFCADVALDFSGTGVNAYIITGNSGSAITKSDVLETVPANTPLLLNATEGNYNIPVVTSSSTDVSGNLLKAGTGEKVTAEVGKTKYVLAAVESVATFLKINATPATVPVGKAYLEFSGAVPAPSLRIVEEDQNATGIDNIEASDKAVKFIENGRILIKKNGIVYDALGRIVK